MEEEKVKSAISDSDKKKIEDKCDECIKWLDANQMGEKDEYEDKQKEVEAVCNPIIQNLYSGAGGTFTFDQNRHNSPIFRWSTWWWNARRYAWRYAWWDAWRSWSWRTPSLWWWLWTNH